MKTATLSNQARRDVNEAVEWIAQDNPIAAEGLLDAVLKAADRIGHHPSLGARRPELTEDPQYRFLSLTRYPYLIVYPDNRDPPVIVRVLHTTRDLPRFFRHLR